jgi:hypothetical protein
MYHRQGRTRATRPRRKAIPAVKCGAATTAVPVNRVSGLKALACERFERKKRQRQSRFLLQTRSMARAGTPAPWCPPPKGPEGIRRESVSIRGFGSRNSDVAASRAENKNDGSRAPPRIPDPTSRLDFCQKAPGYITIIEETPGVHNYYRRDSKNKNPTVCSQTRHRTPSV